MKYLLFFIFLMGTMAVSSQQAKAGIGLSESTAQAAHEAVFLCVKSQLISIMSGWVGSRKTGRFVDPVDQPTQSGAMIGLMLSGLNPNQRSQP
jgi:putative Mn2+ efflux pump MntP